jgi:hypothetical protein
VCHRQEFPKGVPYILSWLRAMFESCDVAPGTSAKPVTLWYDNPLGVVPHSIEDEQLEVSQFMGCMDRTTLISTLLKMKNVIQRCFEQLQACMFTLHYVYIATKVIVLCLIRA